MDLLEAMVIEERMVEELLVSSVCLGLRWTTRTRMALKHHQSATGVRLRSSMARLMMMMMMMMMTMMMMMMKKMMMMMMMKKMMMMMMMKKMMMKGLVVDLVAVVVAAVEAVVALVVLCFSRPTGCVCLPTSISDCSQPSLH